MFVFEEEGDRVSVDDVLDAGDRDFFKSKEVEMDYFNLIDAIRGSAKRKNKEKVITLYTARPVAHRNQLQALADKKLIPNNIFLTTSESEAEGYSIDLASEEKRDLWIVKIRQKYLTQTLDSPGGVKNYQTFSREEYVPVVEMWRISG
jgi:hypothetical protein